MVMMLLMLLMLLMMLMLMLMILSALVHRHWLPDAEDGGQYDLWPAAEEQELQSPSSQKKSRVVKEDRNELRGRPDGESGRYEPNSLAPSCTADGQFK
jgi:hypothetical protein